RRGARRADPHAARGALRRASRAAQRRGGPPRLFAGGARRELRSHTLYIRCMSKDRDLIRPKPLDLTPTERVTGGAPTGAPAATRVTVERALTIFLNSQEIVTAMTINDYPEYLALGYLLNQNMLRPDDVVTGVDYDEELAVVVVRTRRKTNYEKK